MDAWRPLLIVAGAYVVVTVLAVALAWALCRVADDDERPPMIDESGEW